MARLRPSLVLGLAAAVAWAGVEARAEPPPAAPEDASRSAPQLDVPGPPSEPGLSHTGTVFDLEYTAAGITPTDVLSYAPIAGERAFAYAGRLAVETPLELRTWYLGLAAGLAAASVPAGTAPGSGGHAFVPSNPELWVRGLWSNRLGLSAGGSLGLVIPLPRKFGAVASEVVRTLRAVHPSDYPTFQDLTLTLRPSFVVRHVVGPLTLQGRQGLDLAVVTRDPVGREHRVELGGVGSLFASVAVVDELSLGLELAEVYALSADVSSPECPAPCDAQRFGVTLAPIVRVHSRWVSPALSLLVPLMTPLGGEAASYLAARLDLQVVAPWGLADLW
ncbi:MAG: hypothetical protein IT373_33430 [Polyangiaceae bacterium]|nr:hypothetical protein [Polyangiaceae bacterium]